MTALIGIIVKDDDAESACHHAKPAQTATQAASSGKNGGNGTSPVTKINGLPEEQALEVSQFAPPKLDGVTYKNFRNEDGSEWIIAVGDTYPKKDILASTGFRWNAQKNLWWRYADLSCVQRLIHQTSFSLFKKSLNIWGSSFLEASITSENEILELLADGLKTTSLKRKNEKLEDRSAYLGLSDLSKALTCERAVILDKLSVSEPSSSFQTLLRLLRRHWLFVRHRDGI
jgi:hypothetical protein